MPAANYTYEMPSCSGIYQIKNVKTGRSYIGSAENMRDRQRKHVSDLNLGVHHSYKLQRAWDKYGFDGLEFSVLEQVDSEMLLLREQYWIDKLRASHHGYNVLPTAGTVRGYKQTPESIAKRVAKTTGKKRGEAALQNMREAQRSRVRTAEERSMAREQIRINCHNPEAQRKAAENSRWYRHPPEVCAKISASLTGKKLSPEHIEKMRESRKGIAPSAEAREKISAALKGRKKSPEHVAKVAAANRGKKKSPEQVEQMRIRAMGVNQSPETIAKRNASRAVTLAKKKAALAEGVMAPA